MKINTKEQLIEELQRQKEQIEKLQKAESERKKAEKTQTTLYNIANAANTTSNLDELFKNIHKELGKIIDTTNFYIALYDEKSDIVSMPYYIDQTRETPAPKKIQKGLTNYVIRTQKPVFLTVQKREELIKAGEIAPSDWKSKLWLGVPLKIQDKIIGALAVQSYDDPHHFNENDLKILEFVSDQVAVVINRIHLREELDASEKKYRQIFEEFQDLYFLTDLKGIIKDLSPSVKQLGGYEREELIGTSVFGILVSRKQQMKFLKDLLRNKSVSDYELVLNKKSGEKIETSATAHIIYDENNRPFEIEGVLRDITERRKATEQINIQKAYFENLFEFAPDAIAVVDNDDYVLQINNEFTHLFGYTKNEAQGKKINDLVVPEELKMNGQKATKRVTNGETIYFDTIRQTKEGRKIDVSIIGKPIFYKREQLAVYAIYRDISTRKISEKIQKAIYNISHAANTTVNLQKLIEKIRYFLGTVLDTTNFYIALYDEENDLLTLPFMADEKDEATSFPAEQTITGYVIKTGKPLLATKRDIEDLTKAGKTTIVGSLAEVWLGVPLKIEEKTIGVIAVQSYTDKNLYSKKDLELFEFVSREIAVAIERQHVMENLKKTNSELISLKTTLEKRVRYSVKELRQKDHILIQQSRQASMGEMIGNIAHQWRQPLAAVAAIIQNYEDAYEEGTLDMDYIDKHTDLIMDILTQMSRTIDDFRYFFRPNKMKSNFNVKSVVLKTLKFLESSFKFNNINLTLDMAEDCELEGFPNEYSQVILVILTNSKDALLEREIKDKKIEISLGKYDNKTVLKIFDNAGGIKNDVLPKIFDPYFTTKEQGKGTGVGLYMSKTIVEKNMSGKLTCKNIAEGAEFKVVI